MRFKKYYKDILSLIASLSLLASVYFANHYDIKQLYREFFKIEKHPKLDKPKSGSKSISLE